MIEDDETTYIIIARGFQKQADGYLAGYKAVPHPQGASAGYREVVIRGSQVVKVLHLGYEDATDEVFATDQLEQAKSPSEKPVSSVPEPELTVDLATTDGAATDAGAAQAVTSGGLDQRDPFREFRRKGRQA